MKLRYRPDPDRSVIEDLYSSEENPSPVLSLLEELYAIHAIGLTKFWVKDEKEISSMKLALRVCCIFNVGQHIETDYTGVGVDRFYSYYLLSFTN